MTSLLKSISRVLRIGREKYLAGYDLHNNAYYEFPSRSGSKDPRHTRRTIVWKEQKDFSEYDQSSLPVQWKMWLRHTRRSPPTIEELQQDVQRIRLTQYNASILAAKDEEARLRLSQSRNQTPFQISDPSTTSSSSNVIPDDDVWAASKARIQSQDSKALNAGVNPQPNTSTSEASGSSSFANRFGMGLSSSSSSNSDEKREIDSEFTQALNRREAIRKERESKDEFERKEAERRKWLLNKSILEDFDPQVSSRLQTRDTSSRIGNQNQNQNGDGGGARGGEERENFRKETQRQADVVEKIGNERGLGNRSGRPSVPSGEFSPGEWNPGVAKRG